MDSQSKPLERLIAAVFTPFANNGEVNYALVPEFVDHLRSRGISGLYVNGTTGEGPSLTTSERKQLAEAFVGAAAKRIPVIVQVGHNSVEEARDLANHAQRIGADAISATPPGFFRPDSVTALVEVVNAIASAAAELPFYYYHIPAFGGVTLDIPTFIESSVVRIPNFRGVKFSSPNLHEFDRCRRSAGGNLDMFFGVDEMLLGGLAMGVRAAVGSTYNFAPSLYLALWQAFEAGEMESARALQSQSVDMIQILATTCGRAGLKAAMALAGIDCGGHRLPLSDPSAGQLAEMEKRLSDADLLKWIKSS